MSLSVSSSDLERARGLARQLASLSGTPVPARAPGARLDGGAETGVATPAPDPWDAHLAFCRAQATAEGLLVVDRDGLVIARAGDWGRHDVDSIGARLLGALEQAELMVGLAQGEGQLSVAVAWGAHVLSGWRIDAGAAALVVGSLGRAVVSAAARGVVSARIREALAPAAERGPV